MKFKHHIFLSYSRRDTSIMQRIRDSLIEAGLIVWTDEKLTAGTPSWKTAIEAAIQEAGCIVVILSPDSKESVWVERELDYANMLHKRIFPILVAGEEATAIPFELVSSQYVDVRTGYQDAMISVCNAINQYLSLTDQFTADVSSNTLLVKPSIPLHIHVRYIRRMIGWYFLHPNRLQTMHRLGYDREVKIFKSWMTSGLIWLALLIPQIVAFPGKLTYLSSEYVLLSWVSFFIAWPMMAQLGTIAQTRRGFLWQIFLRFLVILILPIGAFFVHWIITRVLYPNTTSNFFIQSSSNFALVLIIYVSILLSLWIAGVIGSAVHPLGRFRMIALFSSIAILAIVVLSVSELDTDYPQSALFKVGLFLSSLFIGIPLYNLIVFVVRHFTQRRSIAQIVGATLTCGVIALVVSLATVFYLTRSNLEIITFQTAPHLEIVLIMGIGLSIGGGIGALILCGVGSLFSIRQNDALILGANAVLLTTIISLLYALFLGYLHSTETTFNVGNFMSTNISYFSVLLFIPLGFGMFAGGVATSALRGLADGLNAVFVMITVIGAAYLMFENAAVIGIGLRGIVLFLSLGLILIQVYVHKMKLPNTLVFLVVLTISIGLLIGFFQNPQPNILVMLVLNFGFIILGGGLISNFVRETPRGPVLLTLALGLTYSFLPIAYGLNL